MKRFIILFGALCVFSPLVLYAQVLTPADIDIFINGIEVLSELEMTEGLSQETTAAIEKYIEQCGDFPALFTAMDTESEIITDNELPLLQEKWNNLLEITVPEKMESAFQKMGWSKNGHKKMWTIIYCFGTLMAEELYGLPNGVNILNVFDKADMQIVKERKREIQELMGTP